LKNNFTLNILHVNIFNSGGDDDEGSNYGGDKGRVGGGEVEVVVKKVLVERVVVVVEKQKWWLKYLDDIISRILFIKYFIELHELKIFFKIN